MPHRPSLAALLLALLIAPAARAADAIPPIARVLPPIGLEIPAEVRTRLEKRLAETKERLNAVQDRVYRADIEIFTKAVELALRHREFYVERDFAKADWALDRADERLAAKYQSRAPWERSTGLIVQGYRSRIDGSAQPYGLVIPEKYDFSIRRPLYVWLHGRGDKSTDLHFLQERATRAGQIAPPDAIVLHPFGRHCVGWKHAGEIDVLEAVASVKERYSIDPDRIVLIGFSMGGAGAWHLGAHYSQNWIAVSPGAGFAETARYQRLTPDKFLPAYEQTLWGLYDVPNYVRNLFNTQTIAYSGELDKQIQAARVMEEAFQSEGRKLTHLIGPGVEHKYEPATLKELQSRLQAIVAAGPPKSDQIHVQTRTLRYPGSRGVRILRLNEHWQDTRIDLQIVAPKKFRVTTKNVAAFELGHPLNTDGVEVEIDGANIPIKRRVTDQTAVRFAKLADAWTFESEYSEQKLGKGPRLQGPIDDAFMNQILVVAPTGVSKNADFQRWCVAELAHFQDRWRALMRGELPVVKDTDVDPDRLPVGNLVLWGDADSNVVIKALAPRLPIHFAGQRWSLGEQSFDGNRFAPVCIYPHLRSGLEPTYIVLNSGLTFREGHDGTNSLQNPKLPDWAIVDLMQPPDKFAPGRIHDAGFFDEKWQLKAPPKAP